MAKRSIYLKRGAAILLLLACVVLGLELSDSALRTYSEEPQAVLPENSVDVALIGSSHLYCGVIPQLLMDEFGIAANNYSFGYLMGENALHMLKHVADSQSPSVVVLDLFSFLAPYTYVEAMNADALEQKNEMYLISYQRYANSLSWLSAEKYRTLAANYRHSPETLPYGSLSYVSHERLMNGEMNALDHKQGLLRTLRLSYEFSDEVAYPGVAGEPASWLDKVALHELYAELLQRIVEYSRDNGMRLVFTVLPYRISAEERKVCDEIGRRFAGDGVEYISMDELVAGAKIDLATDYRDVAHLNDRGAVKATRFLGERLKNGLQLVDRRADGDPKYDAWRLRPYSYVADEAAARLKHTSDVKEYLGLLRELNEDYTVLLDFPCLKSGDVLKNIWDALENVKSAADFDDSASRLMLLHGGAVHYEREYAAELLYTDYIMDNGYRVEAWHNAKVDMRIDGERVNADAAGQVTVVVYDALREEVADSVVISYDGAEPVITRKPATGA